MPDNSSPLSRMEAPPKPSARGRVLAGIVGHENARTRCWLAAVIAFFGLTTAGVAVTRRPFCDESWFADIAYNLIHHGVMGLTILDPRGFVFAPLVPAIDRYTYWVMPGYIFLQALWYQVFGMNLFTMRALSLVWGMVALVSWFSVVRGLTGDRAVALLSVLVLAADEYFTATAATGRMDMMCAALCLAASAFYLHFRARFHLAILVACSVLAAALLTHPNAVFGAILLSLIVFWMDRDKLRPRTALIAAIPFVVALGLWSIYVAEAPGIFVAQMRAQSNVPHRFQFDWNLLRQFRDEFNTRYAGSYRLYSASLVMKLTGSVLLLYILSIAALAAIPTLRNQPGAKLILTLIVVDFTLLSSFQRNWYYLVYVLPLYAAAVAICAVWLWRRGAAARWVAGLGIVAIVSLNSGVNGFRMIRDDYRRAYVPIVRYLIQNSTPDSLVVGSGELAFDLGFEGRVLDDCRLGVTSGHIPDFIVLERFYRQFWFSWLSATESKTYRKMMDLLDKDYVIVYDQTQEQFRGPGTSDLRYQIFRRKTFIRRASHRS